MKAPHFRAPTHSASPRNVKIVLGGIRLKSPELENHDWLRSHTDSALKAGAKRFSCTSPTAGFDDPERGRPSHTTNLSNSFGFGDFISGVLT